MITSSTGIQSDISDNEAMSGILRMGMGEFELWKATVKSDSRLFTRLFEYIFLDNHRLAWRSCWIIDCASEESPELLNGKLPAIINGLLTTKNGSLKRHFTRILCRYDIPEQYLGCIVDRCFELLVPAEPPAVRVNAMQLLYNIAQLEPDLKGELITVLEGLLDEGGSAGFVNRCGRLLRQLRA